MPVFLIEVCGLFLLFAPMCVLRSSIQFSHKVLNFYDLGYTEQCFFLFISTLPRFTVAGDPSISAIHSSLLLMEVAGISRRDSLLGILSVVQVRAAARITKMLKYQAY